MMFISHRGNINGRIPEKENSPEYIYDAMLHDYYVEVDVRLIGNKFLLGHDNPQYETDPEFLTQPYLWCHAKDITTFAALLELKAHTFIHDTDDATLTSRGFIWTYPGKILTKKSIGIIHEPKLYPEYTTCAGICSDNIKFFREALSGK